MTVKATALHEVITALVTALDAAVSYPVFYGQPTRKPRDEKYVVLGAIKLDDQSEPTEIGDMAQAWDGLGCKVRKEELRIFGVAYGRAETIALASEAAISVVQDVLDALGPRPTSETYNALISEVSSAQGHNVKGAAIVHVPFIVTATARLS